MRQPRTRFGTLASIFIVAISACSTSPPTTEPSRVVGYPIVDPCPSSAFPVHFATGSADVVGDAIETLDAAAARARACGSVASILSHGYAEQADLAKQRAQVALEWVRERGVRIRDYAVIVCASSSDDKAVVTIVPGASLPNIPC